MTKQTQKIRDANLFWQAEPIGRLESDGRSCCIVSCGGEVVSALGGGEEVEEAADCRPEGVDGSLGRLAQERLELGKAFSRRLCAVREQGRLDIGLEALRLIGPSRTKGAMTPRGAGRRRRCRFPMAVRDADTQAFAAAAAAVAASHLGRSPGLVDEDNAFGIEIKLAFEPGLAPHQNVGSVLLGRMRGLFCA